MRYMLLIYSRENEAASSEELQKVAEAHRAVMTETSRRGIFCAAEPLASSATATTVRVENGTVLLTDGPFVESKEQVAGYYILDCQDLDEALGWAARIPTACGGAPGCVEVRPIREMVELLPVHG
jgi:hypothetical protein